MSSEETPNDLGDVKVQCKDCFKRAVTSYKGQPVCAKHWRNATFNDDKIAAKDVLHLGPLPIDLSDMDKDDPKEAA